MLWLPEGHLVGAGGYLAMVRHQQLHCGSWRRLAASAASGMKVRRATKRMQRDWGSWCAKGRMQGKLLLEVRVRTAGASDGAGEAVGEL